MSVNGVEQILWEICNVPERTIEMREHPDQFVRDKGLNEEEQRMVRQLDVRGLAGYQVNQMLIMMTWNILNGADRFPDYVNQLVGTAPAASQTSIGRSV